MCENRVKVIGSLLPEFKELLTPEAVDFLVVLSDIFGKRRERILQLREERQERINQGIMPDFLEDTEFDIRKNHDWQIAPAPKDLEKRWVELTGPAGDRKMVINAFNSGADVYMADFEDSQSPTWHGLLQGQINLYEAVRRTISFEHPKKGKIGLNEKIATLMVRPRGWHLLEKHFLIDDQPISASLFDFGLFFYHNAEELLKHGSGPYFYLPKLESYIEAWLWNDIFSEAERYMKIPRGKTKATVLIESILAVFEAEEILWALREHSVGENVGRWDYIASFGKKFRNHKSFVLPDRGLITMTKPFLKSYVDYVIRVCHKRGAHAIGGMAAQIPIKDDPEANELALVKVRADKEREVKAGHDGTWVAHPDLVPIAREIFKNYLKDKPNQIDVRREDVNVIASDLLEIPQGVITEEGLREDINAFVKYVTGWFYGIGAVAIAYYNKSGKLYAYLMEDAATAEIARTQVWKWIRERARLDDGKVITAELVMEIIIEEIKKISIGNNKEKIELNEYLLAVELLIILIGSKIFPEYLTLPAYDLLLVQEGYYEVLLSLMKEKKENKNV